MRERAHLAIDGVRDLIRQALEDPGRIPSAEEETHLIIVDPRDPEWSAENLERGAKLLRRGERIYVHHVRPDTSAIVVQEPERDGH